jgi:hypothetical protein
MDLRRPIFDFAVAGGYMLLELKHTGTTLEDVFLKLTGTGEGVVLTERLHAAEAAGTDEDAAALGGGEDE